MNQSDDANFNKGLAILSAVGTILDSGLDAAAVFGVGSEIIKAKLAATPEGETQQPYTAAELQPLQDLWKKTDEQLSADIAAARAKAIEATSVAIAAKK